MLSLCYKKIATPEIHEIVVFRKYADSKQKVLPTTKVYKLINSILLLFLLLLLLLLISLLISLLLSLLISLLISIHKYMMFIHLHLQLLTLTLLVHLHLPTCAASSAPALCLAATGGYLSSYLC